MVKFDFEHGLVTLSTLVTYIDESLVASGVAST